MALFLASGPTIGTNLPAIRQPEVFSIDWTSPAGRVTHFSGRGESLSGWVNTPGVTGFDMPAFTPFEDTAPSIDGVINRGFRTEPRDVSIPILMYGEDRETYRQMRTDLFTDLNPRGGVAGQLTVNEMDGTSRTLACFYTAGLEGSLDDSAQGQDFMQALIEFRAPDPYWLGESRTSGPIGNGAGKTWFPLYPLSLTGAQALGENTITNRGQVDAYPIFTVRGPATQMIFQNLTTGEDIVVTYALDGNDVAVINCVEDTLFLNGTVNLTPYLDISTVKKTLWGLRPGDNKVNLSIPGLGSTTTVKFTYQERFLAAW